MHVKPEVSNIGLLRAAGVGLGELADAVGADGSSGPAFGHTGLLVSEGQGWVWPHCDGTVADALAGASVDTKLSADDVGTADFYSFQVYETLGCLASATSQGAIEAMASDYLTADLDGLIAVGLEYGYGGHGLADEAVDVSGASPVDVVEATSHLLRQWRQHGMAGRIPTIHAPLEFAPALSYARLINPQGGTLGAGGSVHYALSAYNQPVNAAITPGGGEVGSQLAAPYGWWYMTGPVKVWYSNEYPSQPGSPLEQRRKNRADVLMERTVVYEYDTSLVLAIQATADL